MSAKEKARDAVARPVADRLGGEQPGSMRAAAGAAVAGGATAVVVYRLLRRGGEGEQG